MGMMAVNAATSVGFRLKGKVGAIVCALGVALPSFLIIVFLANLIIRYAYVSSISFSVLLCLKFA